MSFYSSVNYWHIGGGGTPQDTNDTQGNFEWGYCSMSGGMVNCANRQVHLLYQIYLRHSLYPTRINCQVTDNTDSLAHKVCKNETGRSTPTWSNDNISSYRYNTDED